MESFLKRVVEGNSDDDSRRYFLRFGKGDYKRRFLISFSKGSKVKIKGSFEWANDFVKFVRENKEVVFSGKVLSREKLPGKEGRKKSGSFVYEISESSLEEFENAYFYLLDCDSGDIVLKVKKSLPKPGQDSKKIDDKFCSLELELKYWDEFKKAFFWDVSECKKCFIQHEINIKEIVMPSDESNPDKIRELAVRKGNIIRKIECDGRVEEKRYEFEV